MMNLKRGNKMNGVTKISSEADVMMITVTDAKSGALSSALCFFANANIVVDMISQSAPRGTTLDFSFTTKQKYLGDAMKAIAEYKAANGGAQAMVSSGYSKINLFGEEMVTSCGVAAKALAALDTAGIDVALITTSDLDISILLRAENEDTAVEVLNKEFQI
jgi:aspartokinase